MITYLFKYLYLLFKGQDDSAAISPQDKAIHILLLDLIFWIFVVVTYIELLQIVYGRETIYAYVISHLSKTVLISIALAVYVILNYFMQIKYIKSKYYISLDNEKSEKIDKGKLVTLLVIFAPFVLLFFALFLRSWFDHK